MYVKYLRIRLLVKTLDVVIKLHIQTTQRVEEAGQCAVTYTQVLCDFVKSNTYCSVYMSTLILLLPLLLYNIYIQT